MTNKEIAAHFASLARLMEYAGENQFKIRSYRKALDILKKHPKSVARYTSQELQALEGIGKAIAEKIVELTSTGQLTLLERYRSEIGPAAIELLGVRGLGPSKVKQLVKELEVESVGELLQAIRENRVIELKGWSHTTQEKLRQQLEFYQRAQGFARYADVIAGAEEFLASLRQNCTQAALAGEAARQCPVLSELTFVATEDARQFLSEAGFVVSASAASATGHLADFPARVLLVLPERFALEHTLASSSPEWLAQHPRLAEVSGAETSAEVFAKADMPFVPAPQREVESPFPPVSEDKLIELKDIRGVVHAHSTYSDGSTELGVLAKACKEKGYDYLVITDHSKAAGYANGLSIERLREQRQEIDALNAANPEFQIFAGTECDILRDGSLDYPDEVLASLDCVIASIHSVLRMSQADATARLIKAIANPYTTMLGHPTGRLLLSRAGYPLDMEAVLQACAEHQVAIEINANPYRLDLDWRHLQRALELQIPISINPDAHAIGGIDDIKFGVLAAQKGGLQPSQCLNTKTVKEFASYLAQRRAAVT